MYEICINFSIYFDIPTVFLLVKRPDNVTQDFLIRINKSITT